MIMILNNGYKVECPKELQQELKNETKINWFNFNQNEIYFDDDCNEYHIKSINHNMKTIIIEKD